MCGIFGVSFRDSSNGDSLRAHLDQVFNALRHRGPDSRGKWISDSGDVGLLHTRLAIIDRSEAGAQPMVSATGRFVVIFNGEIYNHRELHAELEKDGYLFRGKSDTEVILASIERCGLKASLNIFNGMFALAVFDCAEKKLFIARDRFGIKPLYYRVNNEKIDFSSEINGLIAFDRSGLSFNKLACFNHLKYLYSPGPLTYLENIFSVLPGQLLTIKGARVIEEKSYLSPPKLRCRSKQSFGKMTDMLDSAISSSVASQMVSEVPVGSMLSGGIDSSLISVLAARINPNIECFTVRIDGDRNHEFNSDLKFARQVASSNQLRLNEVRIHVDDLFSSFGNMVHQLDEPLADLSGFNVQQLCNAAKRSGIGVMLSGLGGDDLFGGYRRHVFARYAIGGRIIARLLRQRVIQKRLTPPHNSLITRRLSKLAAENIEGRDRILSSATWLPEGALKLMFEHDPALYSSSMEYDELLSKAISNPDDSYDLSELRRSLMWEQKFYLPDHNLMYCDKMSMSKGVEVRVPFLDNAIFDISKSCLDSYLVNMFRSKFVLKKVAQRYLDKEIISREKVGFGLPLSSYLSGPLNYLVQEYLNEERMREVCMIPYDAVKALVRESLQGGNRESHIILQLIMLEIKRDQLKLSA